MKKTRSKQFKKHLANLESYLGNWVAFINNRPVVWAEDLKVLMQKIKEHRFPKEPSVMLVPRKDEGPYILIIL